MFVWEEWFIVGIVLLFYEDCDDEAGFPVAGSKVAARGFILGDAGKWLVDAVEGVAAPGGVTPRSKGGGGAVE